MAYINSLRITTPPADECDQPEEGLEDNEVTNFYFRMLFSHLRNNIVKGNQNQVRKIIIIMDNGTGEGSHWYQLFSEEQNCKLNKGMKKRSGSGGVESVSC